MALTSNLLTRLNRMAIKILREMNQATDAQIIQYQETRVPIMKPAQVPTIYNILAAANLGRKVDLQKLHKKFNTRLRRRSNEHRLNKAFSVQPSAPA